MEEREVKEIQDYILSVFDKIIFSEKDIDPIINFSIQDKKNVKGIVNFSLLKKIGEATYNIPVSRSQMLEALIRYIAIK
jgi:3-dehydroquinate synthase